MKSSRTPLAIWIQLWKTSLQSKKYDSKVINWQKVTKKNHGQKLLIFNAVGTFRTILIVHKVGKNLKIS